MAKGGQKFKSRGFNASLRTKNSGRSRQLEVNFDFSRRCRNGTSANEGNLFTTDAEAKAQKEQEQKSEEQQEEESAKIAPEE